MDEELDALKPTGSGPDDGADSARADSLLLQLRDYASVSHG